MTLKGVMAVILRYFCEFVYLPGVLRKSSRSLSHLLMSSCNFLAQKNTINKWAYVFEDTLIISGLHILMP